jgi:hypothetical protein
MGEREIIPLMPPHLSPKAPDGQPTNPTGGVHPSDQRRREREALREELHRLSKQIEETEHH